MLREALKKVLDLQGSYSSSPTRTAAMVLRGQYIKDKIPELLKDFAEKIGLRAKGRDGVTRLSRVPYVRVFDQAIAPNSTDGKYAVFLFAADGSAVFLSLNQGTRDGNNRALPARNLVEVSHSSESARSSLRDHGCAVEDLHSKIELKNPSRRDYELGNIYAFRYDAKSIPHDEQIYQDLSRLLALWNALYPNAKTGPNPGGRIRAAAAPAPAPSPTAFEFYARPWAAVSTSAVAQQIETQRQIILDHNVMQGKLYERLVEKFGKTNVGCENCTGLGTRIDIVVRDGNKYWFYEIKTDLSPRVCIREAIGQLLEYAFFGSGRPDQPCLIIVGKTEIDKDGKDYLDLLNQRFSLSINYEVI